MFSFFVLIILLFETSENLLSTFISKILVVKMNKTSFMGGIYFPQFVP